MVDLLDVVALLTIGAYAVAARFGHWPARFGFMVTAVSVIALAFAEAASFTDLANAIGVVALSLFGCSIVHGLVEVSLHHAPSTR